MAEWIPGRPESTLSGRSVCVVLAPAEMRLDQKALSDPTGLPRTVRRDRPTGGIARALMQLECARAAIDDEIARLRHIQAQRTS